MGVKTPRSINPDFDATPIGAVTVLDISNTSVVTSSEVGATVVRLAATKDCHVAVGTAPVAQTTDTLIFKQVPEKFSIPLGEKMAVVREENETSDGFLYITNCDG